MTVTKFRELMALKNACRAAVAAILCLGLSFGQRVTRVVEVAVGVFLGVAVGDAFVLLFGTGAWQIGLAV